MTRIREEEDCTCYKIPLIYIDMAGSEIQSTIFVSRQPAMQNIYLTTYQNKKLIFLRKFSQASLASKIVPFKAYCQLWSSSFQFSLNKLKVAYNDAFRLLLSEPRWCSASSLFVCHNVPTFDALIRKLIYALWCSCHNSSNVLVDKLLASESKLFKRWQIGASYCTNVVFCCFKTFFSFLHSLLYSHCSWVLPAIEIKWSEENMTSYKKISDYLRH